MENYGIVNIVLMIKYKKLEQGKGIFSDYDKENIFIRYEGEYLNGERNGKG